MNVRCAVACASAAAGIAALMSGELHWRSATARAAARLISLSGEPEGDAPDRARRRFSPDAYAGVPEVVARYFRYALEPGQPLIVSARLSQRGVLRSGHDAPWLQFSATECFSAREPGFVWDASARALPQFPLQLVRIRDSYVEGVAASEASLAGLISLGAQRANAEVTSASLVRYLAECAWLPTALLPGAHLAWRATGAETARATLCAGATSVSIDVTFGALGEIKTVQTDRYRDVGGRATLTPWIGRFNEYERVQGMLVPMSAEVAWVPTEGYTAVWRGRIVAASYELAT